MTPADGRKRHFVGFDRALVRWQEHDLTHALHGQDREFVGASEAPRALVLERLVNSDAPRDLYSACAQFGRLMAASGVSPSLAAATLDGAEIALSSAGMAWESRHISPARASLSEGFVAAIVDRERANARRQWEYPACAVQVTKRTVAIAAGHPTDDTEALTAWAARVATAVSRAGYRDAIVSGDEAARHELVDALSIVGVAQISRHDPSGWFASLRRRL